MCYVSVYLMIAFSNFQVLLTELRFLLCLTQMQKQTL